MDLCVRRVGPDFAVEAVAILREATAWSTSRGIAVWADAELRDPEFVAAARAGELVIGFADDRAAATMLLQAADDVYWPEAAPGSGLYLHKLAVRRAFAGQGWPGRLIEFAAHEAQLRGIGRLRLDTLARLPLQSLYEAHGFSVLDEEPLHVRGRRMIRMERAL
jgi:ribosomal protein S18 acetylase RimI-like enzyme